MQRWQRTYWAVFVANLVTAVGMMSFLPFFPSYLEEMGLEDPDRIALWTGLVFGAAPFAAAIMGPVWGSIGDRFGRKVMVLRALFAISVFVGCIGFARTPWQLFLLRLCQGVFSGFVPPSITLVSVAAPREAQGRIAGSLQASLAAGSIIGPKMGYWVQLAWGIRSIYFVVAALSALGALVVWCFAEEAEEPRRPQQRTSPGRLLADVWSDLRELMQNQRVRMALVVLFCVQFGFGATNPMLELLVGSIGYEDEARRRLTSTLFTTTACAQLVATPLWGRAGDRYGYARAMTLSALAAAAVLGAHAVLATYALLLAARVGVGLTVTGPTANANGLAAVESRAERRGGAFGAMFSARALAVSLGSVAGGGMASLLGVRRVFVVAALLVCAALVASRRLARRAPVVPRPTAEP